MLSLIFIVLAVICFLLAAAGVAFRRLNLVALGLFFWSLTLLVPKL